MNIDDFENMSSAEIYDEMRKALLAMLPKSDSNQIRAEIAYQHVETLSALKSALGLDKYEK